MRLRRTFAFLALMWFAAIHPAAAKLQLWLVPSDNITQPQSTDLAGFFERPNDWRIAAGQAKVIGIQVNYLLKSPPDTVSRVLRRVAASGLKLDVGVQILQVDKKICGDGVEGMVWPGEVAGFGQRLKQIGADVYSFSFDLPLSDTSISPLPKACHLPIAEAARRVADAVKTLRTYYPHALMIDTEVPTGMPVEKWSAILREWLTAYKAASGQEFDGFTMDVWYHGRWQDNVRASSAILAEHGVPSGVILDASEGPRLSAAEYISMTKGIYCNIVEERIRLDYMVIADWLDLRVLNLPESDPNTLTGLLNWVALDGHCAK